MKALSTFVAALSLVGAAASPAMAAVYYHHGQHYSYRYGGRYYHYRYHGRYYNHRHCYYSNGRQLCTYR